MKTEKATSVVEKTESMYAHEMRPHTLRPGAAAHAALLGADGAALLILCQPGKDVMDSPLAATGTAYDAITCKRCLAAVPRRERDLETLVGPPVSLPWHSPCGRYSIRAPFAGQATTVRAVWFDDGLNCSQGCDTVEQAMHLLRRHVAWHALLEKTGKRPALAAEYLPLPRWDDLWQAAEDQVVEEVLAESLVETPSTDWDHGPNCPICPEDEQGRPGCPAGECAECDAAGITDPQLCTHPAKDAAAPCSCESYVDYDGTRQTAACAAHAGRALRDAFSVDLYPQAGVGKSFLVGADRDDCGCESPADVGPEGTPKMCAMHQAEVDELRGLVRDGNAAAAQTGQDLRPALDSLVAQVEARSRAALGILQAVELSTRPAPAGPPPTTAGGRALAALRCFDDYELLARDFRGEMDAHGYASAVNRCGPRLEKAEAFREQVRFFESWYANGYGATASEVRRYMDRTRELILQQAGDPALVLVVAAMGRLLTILEPFAGVFAR